ncbi:MAG: hypothetical protein LQ351_003605 [Letrouitia transgressa]|nr:MAG: hypothetical protein LQ351_003605 [Letrouitia transgressa]
MPRYVDDEFVRVRRKGSPARLEAPRHRDAYAPPPLKPIYPRARRNSYQPRNQLTIYDDNLPVRRGRSASLNSGSRRRSPHRTCPSPPADTDADPKAQRNRTLLTAALATITTAAAANNIYQSAKAHGARKKQVREGEMCSAEEKRLRQRGRLLDVVSLGVAAVGVNNARMGWKRWEASRGK